MYFKTKKEAELFQQSFGGFVRLKNRASSLERNLKKQIFKRRWCWINKRVAAIDFVDAIFPYILNNNLRKKLIMAKQFYQYKQNNYHRQGEPFNSTRKKYYQQMKRLNKE